MFTRLRNSLAYVAISEKYRIGFKCSSEVYCWKKNSKFTQLSKVVQAIIGVVVALVGALIIKILLSNVFGL